MTKEEILNKILPDCAIKKYSNFERECIYIAMEEYLDEYKEIFNFAYQISKVMKETGSSHVYFIMQQAFDSEFKGVMTGKDCIEKWEGIISVIERKNK